MTKCSQKGGRGRTPGTIRRNGRRNGGGVVASVFGQSVVPGTLLALQQSYNTSYKNVYDKNYKNSFNKSFKNKSFKRKKFSRRRR